MLLLALSMLLESQPASLHHSADRPLCVKRFTWDVGQKLNGCQFSPDSKHFACMANVNGSTRLVVWNVHNSKQVSSWELPDREFPEYLNLNIRGNEEVYFVQFVSPSKIVINATRVENKNEYTFYIAVADLESKALTHHQFRLSPPSKHASCSFHFASHAPFVLAYVSHPDDGSATSSTRSGYWIRANTLTGERVQTGYLDSVFSKHYGFNPRSLSPDGNWLLMDARRHENDEHYFPDGSGRRPAGLLLNLVDGRQGQEILFSNVSRGADRIRGHFSNDGKLVYWQEFNKVQWFTLERLSTIQTWTAQTTLALPDGTIPSRVFLPMNGFARVLEYTSPWTDDATKAARSPANEVGSGLDRDGVPTGWSAWRSHSTQAIFLPLYWYNGGNMVIQSPNGQILAQMKWQHRRQQRVYFDVYHFKP